MTGKLDTHPELRLWHRALCESIAREGAGLTIRQMAILLTVYLSPPPHTVRGLARELKVTKPVVTRALDTLGRLGYLKRKRDEADRRNVLIQRTVKGAVYLSEFGEIVTAAGQAVSGPGAP